MNLHCLCGRLKRQANAVVCVRCWDATDAGLKAAWNQAWSPEDRRAVARQIKAAALARKPQAELKQTELL